MLIVYDPATGEVLDNHGTNSRFPDGVPDEYALVNLPDHTLADVALLRLHDHDDADEIARITSVAALARLRVDSQGRVVAGDPHPDDDPVPPPIAIDDLLALLAEARGETVEETRAAAQANADARAGR